MARRALRGPMQEPQRIVSLVPSHTESLHDMGLAHRVVGRTRFCIHPKPWVDGIPHVGGTKDADLRRILALTPDLVVADKDENPLALVEDLQAAGIEVLWSDIDDVQDAADFLRTLGRRCGVEAAARSEAEAIEAALLEVAADAAPMPVFCPIWYDPWMTFNGNAYPDAMLRAVGLENIFAGREGDKYFEVEAVEVAERRPHAVLLPTEPFPFHKRLETLDTEPLGVAPEAVHIIDGEALTWFGTRTADALHTLSELRLALAAGEPAPIIRPSVD